LQIILVKANLNLLMENSIDHRILEKYRTNKYSYNDYLKVKNWLNSDEDDLAKRKLLNEWDSLYEEGSFPGKETIFNRIMKQVVLKKKKAIRRMLVWNIYRNIAAVLIPIVAVSLSIYLIGNPNAQFAENWVKIEVPRGTKSEFQLPDGTKGWLNSGSTLQYPSSFKNHRKVKLQGEAYFNVVHRKDSEFTVALKDMDVKVLGTKFNVSAYAEDGLSEVVLKEGKVEVVGKSNHFSAVLKPEEKISYDSVNRTVKQNKVDLKQYLSWVDGYLVIDNEPFETAVRKIEHWYNVDVTIENEQLKAYRLRATFHNEPLESVLHLLALSTPIVYTIEDEEFDLKGALKKKLVTVKLKN